ncbi:hypothetical protein J8273_1703 [Carpediemonas membranifera]|uniref:Uncharacterized protein n=1 Tax=Carpediemonas membranifera TaxID=201153 RepID=A0A8J6EBA5_9EUKA|nr:hypothetical protein J8273_1703 [Carpediemonas membranifera]|eukprot:KAG9396685.1 hypothetical protein J8273_1703 [Carpediemonas membranifera]
MDDALNALDRTGYSHWSNHMLLSEGTTDSIGAQQLFKMLVGGTGGLFLPIHGEFDRVRQLSRSLLELLTPETSSELSATMDLLTVLNTTVVRGPGPVVLYPILNVTIAEGHARVVPILTVDPVGFTKDAQATVQSGALALESVRTIVGAAQGVSVGNQLPSSLLSSAEQGLASLDVAELAKTAADDNFFYLAAVTDRIKLINSQINAALPRIPCAYKGTLTLALWPTTPAARDRLTFTHFLHLLRDRVLIEAHIPFRQMVADRAMLTTVDLNRIKVEDLAPAAQTLLRSDTALPDLSKFNAFTEALGKAFRQADLPQPVMSWAGFVLTRTDGRPTLTAHGVPVDLPTNPVPDPLADLARALGCVDPFAITTPLVPPLSPGSKHVVEQTRARNTGELARPLFVWLGESVLTGELKPVIDGCEGLYPVRKPLRAVLDLTISKAQLVAVAHLSPRVKAQQLLQALGQRGALVDPTHCILVRCPTPTLAMDVAAFESIKQTKDTVLSTARSFSELPSPAERQLDETDVTAIQNHVGWGQCHQVLGAMMGMVTAMQARLEAFEATQQLIVDRLATVEQKLDAALPRAPSPIEWKPKHPDSKFNEYTSNDETSTMADDEDYTDDEVRDYMHQRPLPLPALQDSQLSTSEVQDDDNEETHPVVQLHWEVCRRSARGAWRAALSVVELTASTAGMAEAVDVMRSLEIVSGEAETDEAIRTEILCLVARAVVLCIRTPAQSQHVCKMIDALSHVIRAQSFSQASIDRALLDPDTMVLENVMAVVDKAVIPAARLMSHPMVFACVHRMAADPEALSVLQSAVSRMLAGGLLLKTLQSPAKGLPLHLNNVVSFLYRAGFNNFWDHAMLFQTTKDKEQGFIAQAVIKGMGASILPGLALVLDRVVTRFLQSCFDPDPTWSINMATTIRVLVEAVHLDRVCPVPEEIMPTFHEHAQVLTLAALGAYTLALSKREEAASLRDALRVAFMALPRFDLIRMHNAFSDETIAVLRTAAPELSAFSCALNSVVGDAHRVYAGLDTIITISGRATPAVRPTGETPTFFDYHSFFQEAGPTNDDEALSPAASIDLRLLKAVGTEMLREIEAIRTRYHQAK